MIEVRHERGVFLPGASLWLDAGRCRERSVVSHAHSDHVGGAHEEAILTESTARLLRARNTRMPKRLHTPGFGEPVDFPECRVALFSAGHVLGSAQAFVECDAGTLLYTGDFKLRASRSAEPVQVVRAETLVMETTFGLPRYVFPPDEEVLADMVRFCRETLDAGEIPVLLGYSLGKAQEILAALCDAELPVMLHDSVEKITAVYRDLGVIFPPHEIFNAETVAGHVLIFPPMAKNGRLLRKIPHRTAMLTGWAMDRSAIYRMGCDRLFPLSDHADYPDLLRFVEMVQPKRVLTLHGFASEFARDLRLRGVEAWALTGPNQLEFRLS